MDPAPSSAPETTAASPGPWSAYPSEYPSGAVYIVDAAGEVIGFATDRAGHTAEDAPPDRRSRAEILRNGTRMALAPELLAVIEAIVASAPEAGEAGQGSGGETVGISRRGGQPHPEFLAALARARAILARDSTDGRVAAPSSGARA